MILLDSSAIVEIIKGTDRWQDILSKIEDI